MSTTSTKHRETVTRKQKIANERKRAEKTGGSVMVPGEILPVEEFMSRVGCTRYGLAGMKARGLVMRKDGHRVVIRYEDYANYVASLPEA